MCRGVREIVEGSVQRDELRQTEVYHFFLF